MTRQQFLDQLGQLYDRCISISKSKNGDYAASDNPFQNFENIAILTDNRITVADGILVRMSDKMQRVTNLLQPGRKQEVIDESLEDTLIDLANYAMILVLWRREQKDRSDASR